MFTNQDCRRNLRWFLFYRLSFDFALWAPVWVLYVDEVLGLTFTELMVLEMIFQFAIAATEIPTGLLADALGRGWSLRAAAVSMSLTLLVWGLADGLWMTLLAWLGWALSVTFVNGADGALVFESLHAAGQGKRFAAVLGRFTSAGMLSAMVAGVIGGWFIESAGSGFIGDSVVQWFSGGGLQTWFVGLGLHGLLREWGYRAVILLHAGLVLFSVFAAFRMKEPPRVEDVAPGRPKEIVRAVWALLKSSDRLRVFLFFSAFIDLGYVVVTLYQQHMLVHAGLTVEGLGWFFAFSTLLGAGGPVMLAWMSGRWGVARVLVGIGTMVTLGVLAVFISPGMWIVLPFVVVRIVASGTRPVVVEGINELIGSRGRATALSLRGIVSALLIGPIGVLTGLWADLHPIRDVFLITGMGLPVALVLLAVLWRRDRAVSTGGEPPAETIDVDTA